MIRLLALIFTLMALVSPQFAQDKFQFPQYISFQVEKSDDNQYFGVPMDLYRTINMPFTNLMLVGPEGEDVAFLIRPVAQFNAQLSDVSAHDRPISLQVEGQGLGDGDLTLVLNRVPISQLQIPVTAVKTIREGWIKGNKVRWKQVGFDIETSGSDWLTLPHVIRPDYVSIEFTNNASFAAGSRVKALYRPYGIIFTGKVSGDYGFYFGGKGSAHPVYIEREEQEAFLAHPASKLSIGAVQDNPDYIENPLPASLADNPMFFVLVGFFMFVFLRRLRQKMKASSVDVSVSVKDEKGSQTKKATLSKGKKTTTKKKKK